MKRSGHVALALALASGVCALPAQAVDSSVPTNGYGNAGLLQTPTARFAPEGTFRVGFSSARPYDSSFVSAHPFNWMEATFRYTKFRYSQSAGDFVRDGYLDKSFDFKFRLLDEARYLPSVAIGVQDFGGTGLLSSEYLVTTKRFGDFDFNVGLGWGRQGSRGDLGSPLGRLDDRFEQRTLRTDDQVGDFELDRLFAGDAAFFGGVRWSPELSPWSVVVEREGNDYSFEPFGNDLEVKFPVNLGLAFEGELFGASIGWVRGTQVVFGVHASAAFAKPGPAKALDPPPTPVAPPTGFSGFRVVQDVNEDEAWRSDVRDALERQNIPLLKLERRVGGYAVTAWVGRSPYREPAKLVGRTARVLAVFSPSSVYWVEVVVVERGLEQTRFKFVRADVRRSASGRAAPSFPLVWGESEAPSLEPVVEDRSVHREWDDLEWSMRPRFRQSFGDPDDSYRAGLFLSLGVRKFFTPSLSSSMIAEAALVSNLDDIERESDSELPHVRSDIASYQREGADGLRQFEVNYIRPLTADLFFRFSVGIFEEMYGGVAAETLFRPYAQNWAVSLNVNRVRQRGFDQRFSFRDYEVTTGHLTFYGRFSPLSIESELSVGRYLAGDVGGTVAIARFFNSGAKIGVFATKTDVSSAEFGEGSFDKGFFFSIPFDLLLPVSTRAALGLSFRPLTRDGGQKVRDGWRLYDATSGRDVLAVTRTGDVMMD